MWKAQLMSFEWLAPVLADSSAEGIWVLIPLAAIVMGGAATIAKMVMNHRERMARIGMGLDPDHDPSDQVTSQRRPHDPTSQVGG
jgi:hypothetical protein